MTKDAFAIIGVLAIGVILVVWFIALIQVLGNLANWAKRKYLIKHRFDKPPTAKCYCRDCVRHNNESERCYKFDGWYTADNWFCWDAEPRKDIKQ